MKLFFLDASILVFMAIGFSLIDYFHWGALIGFGIGVGLGLFFSLLVDLYFPKGGE